MGKVGSPGMGARNDQIRRDNNQGGDTTIQTMLQPVSPDKGSVARPESVPTPTPGSAKEDAQ